MNVSIQSWCRRWQMRSAIEGASAGTWKRLRKALLNPSSTGAGRPGIVACSWRMVDGSRGARPGSRAGGWAASVGSAEGGSVFGVAAAWAWCSTTWGLAVAGVGAGGTTRSGVDLGRLTWPVLGRSPPLAAAPVTSLCCLSYKANPPVSSPGCGPGAAGAPWRDPGVLRGRRSARRRRCRSWRQGDGVSWQR